MPASLQHLPYTTRKKILACAVCAVVLLMIPLSVLGFFKALNRAPKQSANQDAQVTLVSELRKAQVEIGEAVNAVEETFTQYEQEQQNLLGQAAPLSLPQNSASTTAQTVSP